jgi:hypothetical protein
LGGAAAKFCPRHDDALRTWRLGLRNLPALPSGADRMTAPINAVVFDMECVPNYTSLYAIDLNSETEWYFEISQFRNDGWQLYAFLEWLMRNDWFMIGYNNIGYDYNLIHQFMTEPVGFGPAQFYAVSQAIIRSTDRFGVSVRPSDRYIKQIDLYKIHHFDNQAKQTSLKALQVNMRSENVLESELPFDQPISPADIERVMIPYNRHDVTETKTFALISMPMIEFRLSMMDQIKGDVVNFNDTKIGKQLLEQRLEDVCYTYVGNRRERRQTPRPYIHLGECIFPYVQFDRQEFQRVHHWLTGQTITETKGAFDDLSATLDGFAFHFGTGGIHGSLDRAKIVADDEWAILDDDVASLYPSIAIVNKLAPEHLGQRFVDEYAKLKDERFKYAKGTPQNAALKLALNGTYGDSNSEFSVFYDPKFTMSITINGQLLLCMLAERLLTVPTLSLIQINTDGVTYRVHRSMIWMVDQVRTEWQLLTRLDLEQVEYRRMFIRDVNNYIAEDMKGKRKLKGAYWTPTKHPDDIQNASPTAWYKNFSADICAKAAVAAMTDGADISAFIYAWTNPFDFMLREKTQRGHKLFIGETPQQKVTRYYVALQGEPMRKVMPSTHPHREGQFKQARGVSDADYIAWHQTQGNVWSPTVHTKNKSVYDPSRVTNMMAGRMVRECNHVRSFDFTNLDYSFYIDEARKLLI